MVFDSTSTAAVDSPMPRPLTAVDVTASVAHIPNISTKVGFSRMTPLTIRSHSFFIRSPPPAAR